MALADDANEAMAAFIEKAVTTHAGSRPILSRAKVIPS